MSQESKSEKSYFDLHITGLGYLNRIRDVRPKQGESFLACNINALSGPTSKPTYTYFDCRVSGANAQRLVRRCEEAVKADKKVLIGFKLGDLWYDLFTYTKGEKKGQQGVSLKARLLYIDWIKVNGETVYKAERQDADDSADEVAAPAEEAPTTLPLEPVEEEATEAAAEAF
jgi:hypothetical protein